MTDPKSKLEGRATEFWICLNSGDPDAASKMFCDDARFLVPGKETLVGRAAVREHFAGIMAAGTTALSDPKLVEIDVLSDNIGLTSSEFYVSIGGKKLGKSKSFLLWKKVRDNWFIYRDVYNNNF